MKKLIATLFVVTACLLFGEVETIVDWKDLSLSVQENGEIDLFSGKRKIGVINGRKKMDLVKAEIQDGFLILNAAGYKGSDLFPTPTIWFLFTKHPDKTVQNKTVQLEFDISGNENDMTCDFFYDGKYINGKHYWVKHAVTVTKEMQHIVLKQKMPEDLDRAGMRFVLRTPGIYKFGNVKYGIAAQK